MSTAFPSHTEGILSDVSVGVLHMQLLPLSRDMFLGMLQSRLQSFVFSILRRCWEGRGVIAPHSNIMLESPFKRRHGSSNEPPCFGLDGNVLAEFII